MGWPLFGIQLHKSFYSHLSNVRLFLIVINRSHSYRVRRSFGPLVLCRGRPVWAALVLFGGHCFIAIRAFAPIPTNIKRAANMSNSTSRQRGFTLLELFSVVAVSSVLAMAGIPLIEGFQRDHAAAGLQQTFAESLAVARERAVGTGTAVYLCGSADGTSCSSDWNSGWLVYQGSQPKAPGQTVAEVDIIQHTRIEAVSADLKILDENLETVAAISFDSRGFNAASQRLMAMTCESGGALQSGAVFLERSGRVRVGKNTVAEENPSFQCQRA